MNSGAGGGGGGVDEGMGEGGKGGSRKMSTNRPKMCKKLLNPLTKPFKGPPRWNTLNSADWKYQLLFVVNFVKLDLAALNILTKECDLEIPNLSYKKIHDTVVNKYCIFKDQTAVN